VSCSSFFRGADESGVGLAPKKDIRSAPRSGILFVLFPGATFQTRRKTIS
jgi:hypothetical protein